MGLWSVLHYDDPGQVVDFLVAVAGFEQALVVPDEDGDVVHAELHRPGGGSLVLGSTKRSGGVHGHLRPGTSAFYLVQDGVAEVEQVHGRARAAGAEIVAAPHWTTFGSGADSYVLVVRDPGGVLWTFGTYRGA